MKSPPANLFIILQPRPIQRERLVCRTTEFFHAFPSAGCVGQGGERHCDVCAVSCCPPVSFSFFSFFFNSHSKGFPGGTVVKNPPAKAGDTGSSSGLGRSHMPRSN